MTRTLNIAGRLHTIADDGVLISSDELLDERKNKKQNVVNADVDSALADRYTKSEVYTKQEVNNLVSPNQNYVTVAEFTDLPISGATDTIYRVSSWDGSLSTPAVDVTKYSEYAWDDTGYVFLCVKTQIGEVYDISAANSGAKYADLSAALGVDGGNVPSEIRRGGMSVKFVQSSDNKYVQFRLMSNVWSTNVADWQGVDDDPTVGSDNIVKSGGVADKISELDVKFVDAFAKKAVIGVYGITPIKTGFVLENGKSYSIKVQCDNVNEQEYIGLYYYNKGTSTSYRSYTYINAEQFRKGYIDTISVVGNDVDLYVRTYVVGSYVKVGVVNQSFDKNVNDLHEDLEKVKDNTELTLEKEKTVTSGATTGIRTGIVLNNAEKVKIHIKTEQLNDQSIVVYNYYNVGGFKEIATITAQEALDGAVVDCTPDGDGELAVRSYKIGTIFHIKKEYNAKLNEEVKTLIDKVDELDDRKSAWYGKNVVVYGDSITALGNDSPEGSFFNEAFKKHKFANMYVRGVGGQTYRWNGNIFWCYEDGRYAGRPSYDSIQPSGTTSHIGAFCSWDRITAMIPSYIRETIDLVILCGGTNDHSAVEEVPGGGDIAEIEPLWKANDKTDSAWGSSSYYNGGDYDISNMNGGIASTIMKMRAWCPNAIIVVATPWPRYDKNTKMQYVNTYGIPFRKVSDIEIAMANFVCAPSIDSNAMAGINGIEFSNYIYDAETNYVHPNPRGLKMFGRAFVGELNRIYPKIS